MRVAIIGIGNVLMGDDGVGPYFVRQLEASWQMPAEVEVVDAGTSAAELIYFLSGKDAVIFIDAVRGDIPGSLRLLDREELARPEAVGLRMTPHDPGLNNALLTAELASEAPAEVLFIGVVPQEIELGTRLSPVVEAALPRVEARVIEELDRLGLRPRRRPRASRAEVWWHAGFSSERASERTFGIPPRLSIAK